ncbi:MAG: FtsX-like permease family protein [Devosia sp.]|nr:FtsX-like permease family protein [Devosia sp.]
MSRLMGWLRVALRDLRGDLRRFAILLACLALGVGTITIVGSVGAALQSALLRDARALLGGDLEATLSYRPANDEERALFGTLGRLGEVIEVLGRADAQGQTSFLSIRAVDEAYPLVGTATLEPATPIPDLLALRDGVHGLVADPLLLDRLGLALGDELRVGAARFALRGTVTRLPDQLAAGLTLGVPVLMSVEALDATGILEPGVLARYRYRLLLETSGFEDAAAAIRSAFPDAGFQLSAPRDATADLSRFFDIFGRFLTIVGLSTLLVGGVGVSSAVAAYVTDRQRSIATMKALGATGARITAHFLTQVMLLVAIGIVLGLALGAALTLAALPVLGDLLGVDLPPVLDGPSLLTAAGFGLLTGFAFGYLPLRRARKLRPALLFRSAGAAAEGALGWRDLVAPGLLLPMALAGLGIYGLAVAIAGRPLFVLVYGLSVIGAFAVLRLAALALQMLLRRLPPLPDATLRNALKAIHRPGAPAPTVMLSLGLGLSLLLLITLIDGNLRHQLSTESIPNAPSFVFMDLFEDEVAALSGFAGADAAIADFTALPMIRGRIETINGTPVAALGRTPPPEFAFLFEEEIPLSAAAVLPERSSIVSGAWWPADHAGEPLVSVFDRLREPLGLRLGDELTFRIFGEEVSARIGSFRDYAWRSGGINFGFVLSPNAFDPFPLSYLGLMKAQPGEDRAVQPRLVAAFPDLIFLPVGDALETFARLLSSVTTAVEVIGGFAVVSGTLVLAGAMIAGRRQREADAMVMKVLGATRGNVVRGYLIEYGLLGLLAALLAAGLALAGTWAFVEFALEIDFWVDPWLMAWVILGTIALTVAVGTASTWTALSVRPASFLRDE